MERNIQDMYQRWDRLVGRILRSKSVYIMEGVLFDNILRYFFVGHTTEERIQHYFTDLLQHLAPVCPVIVFLHRPNVRPALETLYAARGEWWRKLILNPQGYGYCEDRGLMGEDGAYTMWQDYEDLSDRVFDRLPGMKIRINTTGSDWETYIRMIDNYLGLEYYPPVPVTIVNPEKYCGRYTVVVGGELHKIEIDYDGTYLFCSAWWPYMRLQPLGQNRFTFASFPINLKFKYDSSGSAQSVHASGIYDWEIVGTTLSRSS
jgi:hypothetical protein